MHLPIESAKIVVGTTGPLVKISYGKWNTKNCPRKGSTLIDREAYEIMYPGAVSLDRSLIGYSTAGYGSDCQECGARMDHSIGLTAEYVA